MRKALRHTQAPTSRISSPRRTAWANASVTASLATSASPDQASTDRHNRSWCATQASWARCLDPVARSTISSITHSRGRRAIDRYTSAREMGSPAPVGPSTLTGYPVAVTIIYCPETGSGYAGRFLSVLFAHRARSTGIGEATPTPGGHGDQWRPVARESVSRGRRWRGARRAWRRRSRAARSGRCRCAHRPWVPWSARADRRPGT